MFASAICKTRKEEPCDRTCGAPLRDGALGFPACSGTQWLHPGGPNPIFEPQLPQNFGIADMPVCTFPTALPHELLEDCIVSGGQAGLWRR